MFYKDNNICLRKGTYKDCKEIAELIYSSGTDVFNYLFLNKENALKYIEFEFKTILPSFFGKTYSWVGEDKNRKVISSTIIYNKM